MYRRLYYLFPSRADTKLAVEELEEVGIDEKDIHTYSGDGKANNSLPPATPRQTRGFNAMLEKTAWEADLIIFFSALAGLMVALYYTAWTWVLTAAVVMTLTYLSGKIFTEKVPSVHSDEFKDAMRHHEILLSVDVPKKKVPEIDKLLQKHPKAVSGGASWSLHHFGITHHG